MTKDDAGTLYVLDGPALRISRYDPTLESWHVFVSGRDYIDLQLTHVPEWDLPSAIAVGDEAIYVSHHGGAITKHDTDGRFLGQFEIDEMNLGLVPVAKREASETWLVSLTLGPFGNLYALDVNAGKVHVLGPDLEYLLSWDDPSRPIEHGARDISFVPGADTFFLLVPTRIHSYELASSPASIAIHDD